MKFRAVALLKCRLRTCLRATVAVLIIGLAFSGDPLNAQSLTRQELEELRGFSERGCFTDQKSRRLNAGISDRVIQRYCQCYTAILYPNSLTMQHLLRAQSILESRGENAMVEYLLMGRNIYDVSNHCTNRAVNP
jgi:hypothetical protein